MKKNNNNNLSEWLLMQNFIFGEVSNIFFIAQQKINKLIKNWPTNKLFGHMPTATAVT